MAGLHYSKTKYMQDGARTIEVVIDDFRLPRDLDFEEPRNLTWHINNLLNEIEKAERKIAERREDEIKQALLKDPQLRLEMLQAERMRLEHELREVSGQIITEQQKLAEKGE